MTHEELLRALEETGHPPTPEHTINRPTPMRIRVHVEPMSEAEYERLLRAVEPER